MAILPKAVYNVILITIPMTFIIQIEKINPKIHAEAQKTMNMNSQGNSKQKQQL
jgi:hypothetical protein